MILNQRKRIGIAFFFYVFLFCAKTLWADPDYSSYAPPFTTDNSGVGTTSNYWNARGGPLSLTANGQTVTFAVNPLWASYRDNKSNDSLVLNDFANTYDQALVAIHCVKSVFNYDRSVTSINELLNRAEAILDFFQFKLTVDPAKTIYPSYKLSDGQPFEFNVRTGEILWVGIAASHYHTNFERYVTPAGTAKNYKPFIIQIANYVRDNLYDASKGYCYAGLDKTIVSTEHNISACAFFKMAAQITGDNQYQIISNNIRNWLFNQAYDSVNGRFYRGVLANGNMDGAFATDTHAWAILLFINDLESNFGNNAEKLIKYAKDNAGLDVFIPKDNSDMLSYETSGFKTRATAVLPGFDFTSRKSTVSVEWTNHMALAYKLTSNFEEAENINKMMRSYMISYRGLPYSAGEIDTTHGWIAPHYCSMAALVWHTFAIAGFNPLVLDRKFGVQLAFENWSIETVASKIQKDSNALNNGGQYLDFDLDSRGDPIIFVNGFSSPVRWYRNSADDTKYPAYEPSEWFSLPAGFSVDGFSRIKGVVGKGDRAFMAYPNFSVTLTSTTLFTFATPSPSQNALATRRVNVSITNVGLGLYNAVAFDDINRVSLSSAMIVYYNDTRKSLMVSFSTVPVSDTLAVTLFSPVTLDGIGADNVQNPAATTNDVGKYVAVSQKGRAIAYYDQTAGDLRVLISTDSFMQRNFRRRYHGFVADGNGTNGNVDGDVGKFISVKEYIKSGQLYVHAIYYDATNKRLRYLYARPQLSGATLTPNFIYSNLDNVNGSDMGKASSLDVDSQGNLHVAYYDATGKQLKYAKGTVDYTANTVSWDSQIVFQNNLICPAVSIRADSSNLPHIVFSSLYTRHIYYVKRIGSPPTFTVQAVPVSKRFRVFSESIPNPGFNYQLNSKIDEARSNIADSKINISQISNIYREGSNALAADIKYYDGAYHGVSFSAGETVNLSEHRYFCFNIRSSLDRTLKDFIIRFIWRNSALANDESFAQYNFDLRDYQTKVNSAVNPYSDPAPWIYWCIDLESYLLSFSQSTSWWYGGPWSGSGGLNNEFGKFRKSFVKVQFLVSYDTLFYLDDIYFSKCPLRDSTSECRGSVSVNLLNFSDNQNASMVTWPSASVSADPTQRLDADYGLSSGWKIAQQYIRLDITEDVYQTTLKKPAVRIYATKNPGLTDETNPNSYPALPVAWRVMSSLNDLPSNPFTDATYGSLRQGTLYCDNANNSPGILWLDKGVSRIQRCNSDIKFFPFIYLTTSKVADSVVGGQSALDYSTVWSWSRGAHYGTSFQNDDFQKAVIQDIWGGYGTPPYYIYLAADFTYAVYPRSYVIGGAHADTGQLIVEYYYE